MIAAVEAEGAQPGRGVPPPGRARAAAAATRRSTREIEERLREKLQALAAGHLRRRGDRHHARGSETGLDLAGRPARRHLANSCSGRRGSAISVALLRGGVPVLGVVHAPLSPDRGRDTIAWAEGARAHAAQRRAVEVDLSRRALGAGRVRARHRLLGAAPADLVDRGRARRATSRMPSIAYRMARVAAGDGVATISTHGVNEYDIAAGMALIRAAGGVLLDAAGAEPIVLAGKADARVSGVLRRRAGGGAAARALRLDRARARAAPRARASSSASRARRDEARFAARRGLPARPGDRRQPRLAGRVQGRGRDRAAPIPRGVRELADGGVYHTIAGQPTDDSEMALALARSSWSRQHAASSGEGARRLPRMAARRARSTSAPPPSAACSACTPPRASRTAR